MILEFVYFELLTRCYGLGQCSDILPLQRILIFMQIVFLLFIQCFRYALFHDRKKKESTDYQTSKKFRTFAAQRLSLFRSLSLLT